LLEGDVTNEGFIIKPKWTNKNKLRLFIQWN
jgi:hypothetical protein